ncbi:hypothetical protein ABIA32_002285 [Streptacidiphilus sp. MAP12-20]|uniref:hypothetical protein n=1 Tax=Streptacidiphilus sp. MAP12-20 TaxID=3156299 RepID=UPI003516B118
MSQSPALPRWPLLTLRVTAALVALLALAQPVLAGGFLQGYYPLLNAHLMAAMILSTAVLLSLVASVLVWRLGGGPTAFMLYYGILLVLCVAQITLGFDRVLLLHIPLGIAIFVMSEKFVTDIFRFKPSAAETTSVSAAAKETAEVEA